MLATIPYPQFDPVAVSLGPIDIRWYALAYICGIVAGWFYARSVGTRGTPVTLTREQADDFIVWLTVGIILGGRIGYVLFYNPIAYLEQPLAIFRLWDGGMAFHGGLAGVVLAIILFALRRGIDMFQLADLVGLVAPIGLFLGRLANFVNGELFGRPADVPWAMVFPRGGPQPRHPSQLYEAALEGIVLFLLLWALMRFAGARRRPGLITGVFLIGYGLARILVEFTRAPDPQLAFMVERYGISMGQLLSLPLLIAGLWLLARALRRPPAAGGP
jgi:phosphatidylglycerol:prolipoprotein diacylglycerol transferase